MGVENGGVERRSIRELQLAVEEYKNQEEDLRGEARLAQDNAEENPNNIKLQRTYEDLRDQLQEIRAELKIAQGDLDSAMKERVKQQAGASDGVRNEEALRRDDMAAAERASRRASEDKRIGDEQKRMNDLRRKVGRIAA